MSRLSHDDITLFFLALAIMLAAARALGELAERVGQPPVLGELVAGLLLGPTLLGRIWPGMGDFFFPHEGGRGFAMHAFFTLSVTLFLLVAGLEVDLSSIWKQGRTAISVSMGGLLAPFAIGFGAARLAPEVMGRPAGADATIYALFVATALSITALPVIARTLMDLNLFRTDMGMIVIASATVNDLAGWLIFSVILGMIGQGHGHSIPATIGLTLAYAAVMLTVGRWLFHRALPWLQAHTRWPAGIVAFTLVIAFLGAACTQWIGIETLFGAFLVGTAIGDSRHMSEHSRSTISQFVASIFAPIFFASVGLRVDFFAHFDPSLCAIVFLIACAGKILGCGVAALASGVPPREAWATGFSMNARGVMEIILGLQALQFGLIDERMFVALTFMAIGTSMMVGPTVQRILRRRKVPRLADHLKPRAFLRPLAAGTRRAAIEELCAALASAGELDVAGVQAAVIEREELMSTALGGGLAVPHARVEGLKKPLVGVGLSPGGVDFDSPDGLPAHVIFLLLTAPKDAGAQTTLLAEIARTFKDPRARERALQSTNATEFLAALKSAETPAG